MSVPLEMLVCLLGVVAAALAGMGVVCVNLLHLLRAETERADAAEREIADAREAIRKLDRRAVALAAGRGDRA